MVGSGLALVAGLAFAIGVFQWQVYVQRLSSAPTMVGPDPPGSALLVLANLLSWISVALGAAAGALGWVGTAFIAKDGRDYGRTHRLMVGDALLWVAIATAVQVMVFVWMLWTIGGLYSTAPAGSSADMAVYFSRAFGGVVLLAALSVAATAVSSVAMLMLVRPFTVDAALRSKVRFTVLSNLGPVLVLLVVLPIAGMSPPPTDPLDRGGAAAFALQFLGALGRLSMAAAFASFLSVVAFLRYRAIICEALKRAQPEAPAGRAAQRASTDTGG